MATMLRSAAMTLLSKTLLTFLYKYLSDVDVEGIEMPSLYYGSAEGAGSGWGVRLSNVKLREGAELMVLPGGRKAKEKGKTSAKNPTDGNSTVSSKGSSKKKKKRRKREEKMNGATPDVLKEDENNALDEANHEGQISSLQNGNAALNIQAGSVKTSSTGDELESESGSLGSLQEASENERPETPTQNSSISFLSCFAHGSSAKAGKDAKKNVDQIPEQGEEETNIPSDAISQEEDDRVKQFTDDKALVKGNTQIDPESLCKVIQDSIDEKLPNVPAVLQEDEDDDEDGGDQSEDEGEDEVVESQPMALRIGENGSIGILDIRYVGRELHVLVEDAFLVLEVVRKELDAGENIAPKPPTDAGNSTADPSTSAESTEKPAQAPTPNTPIDISDLKTTGERVLATNAIARIFSSIPHLSLRDVVVRVIVRSDESSESQTTGQAEVGDTDDCDAELIVDVGVGLLSVTDGDDFVSPFNESDGEKSSNGDKEEVSSAYQSLNATTHAVPSQDNEYLEKRIRTGKGEDGGLWMNIVTPKYYNRSLDRVLSSEGERVPLSMEYRWARQNWLESTHNCFLRISGLDIQARTFLGTRQELSQATGSYLFSGDDMSSYQGIDHTLYGFDHVVPGPTPTTLPPLAPGPLCSASRSMEEGEDNTKSQIYKTDRNGIQSCKISSNFYRVARGMTPTRCTLEHLPCENCFKCWEASGPRTGETVDEAHILDAYTPLPGLTLSVTIRDPLELNVDRLSLSGLGLLIGLFKKEAEPVEAANDEVDPEPIINEEPPVPQTVDEPEPSRGYFSSFFFGSSKTEEGEANSTGLSGLLPKRKSKPKPKPKLPAFPPYMKPENIEVIGAFIGEIRLRIHVMRANDDLMHNNGLSFCYWDAKVQCLTLDQQKLITDDKCFTDTRLDLGLLMVDEFKGVDRKVVVSAGVPHPTGEDDFVSLASLSSSRRSGRPPWPTTASILLDIPAPLESLVYESRERHGVQLRMLKVMDHPESPSEKIRTLFNCQFGVLEMNMPLRSGGLISEVKEEAMKSLGMSKKEEPSPEVDTEADERNSVTQYRVQLGGGRIRMNPSIDVRLPLTRLAGNICPKSGFSMETLLDKVELSYGQSSEKLVPTANSANGVSLKRFPSLPEHVRLRILLFLDDLQPLEKALNLKPQTNSFMRCAAVNKGIGKIAAKRIKKKHIEGSQTKLNRRQQLMNKLLALDDDTLEALWAGHQRKQRKTKKKGVEKAV